MIFAIYLILLQATLLLCYIVTLLSIIVRSIIVYLFAVGVYKNAQDRAILYGK